MSIFSIVPFTARVAPHSPYPSICEVGEFTARCTVSTITQYVEAGSRTLGNRMAHQSLHGLALLWQILSGAGFPTKFFNDSWVVGFWRADHGRQDAGLERRAWTLAQAVSGSVGS